MTGPELKAIRARLKLSAILLGRALGYAGTDATIAVMISKFEGGDREIPPWIGRLATMFDRHGVPSEFILGSPPPKGPGRPPMKIDRDVLRQLADLDWDEGKKK